MCHKCLPQVLGNTKSSCTVCSRKKHREFLAAIPCLKIRYPKRPLEQVADLPQDLVPGLMSIAYH